MKKIIILAVAGLILSACSGARTQSGVSAGAVSVWRDTIPGSLNNSVSPEKQGTSCVKNIMGVVAIGNSSIEAAKKQGKIKNIAFADTTYFNVLGFFQKGCTVVKGE